MYVRGYLQGSENGRVVTIEIRATHIWGVLDITICDKVCQWHAACRWFSPDTPVSSTNKTDHHDITELLVLKMALNTITPL